MNSKKPSTALISSCFGTYGGIEAFVIALGRFLKKENFANPRIVWKRTGNFQLTDQLQQRCYESEVPFTFVSPRSVALWKEIQNADLIHAQNSPPDVVLFSKLQKKPLALTIHNRRMKEHRWKSYLWYGLQRLADRRWYNSNFVRSTWEGAKDRSGSHVIPTVSDLPEGEIPLENRKGFCFASRWIPNKGVEILLEAYAQGNFNPHKWPLHMVGEGPLYRSLRDRYEKTLGIFFHGFVSEEEKSRLIRESKWMVIPPHTQEDLGLTAIEARNVGVPCIATRDGGLPEAAGKAAILCEPNHLPSLLAAMNEAVRMNEKEYQIRATDSKESLKTFLVPLKLYPQFYEEIMKSKDSSS